MRAKSVLSFEFKKNENKNLLPFSKKKKREEILKAQKLGKKYHPFARNSS